MGVARAAGRYVRDVEDTLKRGDFGLVKNNTTVGKLIRGGEFALHLLEHDPDADYQHAFIAVSDEMPFGLVKVVEAMPGGARIGYYHTESVTWSNWDLSDHQRTLIVGAAEIYAELKVGYSFLDYAAITAHALKIPIPHLRAYIRNTGHMICSQLVDQCYLDGGVHLFGDGRWSGFVTPSDLAGVLHA